MNDGTVIRPLSENDDFEFLLGLMNQTAKRFNPDPKFFGFGITAKELKNNYFSAEARSKGFLAVQDGNVIAYLGVSLSKITKNGTVDVGFVEGNEWVLKALVDQCSPIVNQNGGGKLFKIAFCKFGQIRNSEITIWEQLGFRSEEFSNVTISLNLSDWNEPDDFHNTNIYPATDMELSEIQQILIEDGEDVVAEMISRQLTSKGPDQVILTLQDEITKELAGMAYYRVVLANRGTNNEISDASAFGLHFRPKFDLGKKEKRRLLHAALLSMKQLDIYHAYSRITLKNYDVFAMMIREGFDDPGLIMSTIHLFKKV